MDITYYMKLQNAYGTKNKRERELAKVNRNADIHFDDTFDTADVIVNDTPMQVMIIKDTDGNVYKKKIKTRHSDIIRLGDYVKWNNQVWLITLLDPDDKAWNRGYMYLCTILLRWQDDNGNIIERWGYSEDYTKYSQGETGNTTIKIGDYQYGITLPVDDATKKLTRGKRFVIDFEGNYPPDTYRLAGKKAFLTDDRYFGKGGIVTYTLSYNFFNEKVDKLVDYNETQVWICDYHSLSPIIEDKEDVVLQIDYPKNCIRATGKEEILSASLYSKSKDTTTICTDCVWTVDSNISQYLTYKQDAGKLSISLSKEYDDIGEMVKISCFDKQTEKNTSIILEAKGVY